MTGFLFFGAVALFGLAFAAAFKNYFSGEKLNTWQYVFCALFNGFFVVFHIRLIDTGCLMFKGCMEKSGWHYILMGWLALIFAVIHVFSLPTAKESRRNKKRPFN